MTEICPEVHANEIHELFDKVSPNLNSHENTHNSVKHKVIWKRQKGLFYDMYEVPNSGLGAFGGASS